MGSQLGPLTWGERIDFFDLGTLLAPSWAQLAPQMAPIPSKKPSWDHFGAILVSILELFWALTGWKNVPTWLQNSLIKSVSPISKPQRSGGRWAQPVDNNIIINISL